MKHLRLFEADNKKKVVWNVGVYDIISANYDSIRNTALDIVKKNMKRDRFDVSLVSFEDGTNIEDSDIHRSMEGEWAHHGETPNTWKNMHAFFFILIKTGDSVLDVNDLVSAKNELSRLKLDLDSISTPDQEGIRNDFPGLQVTIFIKGRDLLTWKK